MNQSLCTIDRWLEINYHYQQMMVANNSSRQKEEASRKALALVREEQLGTRELGAALQAMG